MVSKKQFFGTDGIRGRANVGKMTPDNVMRFGMAAGKYFLQDGSRRHSVVIGKDTRLSGYMICLLYTSPSPRDKRQSRMPSSA